MSTGKRAATYVIIGVGEGTLVLRQRALYVSCGQRTAKQNPSLLLISTDISSPSSSQNVYPPLFWRVYPPCFLSAVHVAGWRVYPPLFRRACPPQAWFTRHSSCPLFLWRSGWFTCRLSGVAYCLGKSQTET